MTSSESNYLSKTPSLGALTLGVRASMYEFGKGHDLFRA